MNKIILILFSVFTFITYSYAEQTSSEQTKISETNATVTESKAETEESLDGIGATLSLQGFTLFYDRILSNKIGVRVGYNYLKYQKNYSLKAEDHDDLFTTPPDELSISPSLSGSSIPLLFDFYTGSHTGFRFTMGMYLELTPAVTLKLKSRITDKNTNISSFKNITITIGDSDKVLPYLGIGYSTHESNLEGFKFIFDIGVLFSDITHSVKCVGCNQTELSDLKGKKFKNSFETITSIKYVPQVAFGIKYQF
ncbi:MAG: hypothetical protein QM538_05815 [Methylacidiphilales bacterium]|nr:hypothetical protein [Candidatus Methylacidiphilales bacterium]